jgi:hypothetical protein
LTGGFPVWYSIYKVEKGVIAMNNEEKILALLEQMNGRLDTMDARLDKMECGLASLREDVEIIKEDVQITRNAANTLLDWAEQAQVEVKIPLYKKAE